MFVEQAIFTSCRTDRLDGYQLAAASGGVTSVHAEELTAWGPAHDSLLDAQTRAGSINFHQLHDGTHCISKTVPAGAEYSGRQGPKVFTTFLLVSPAVMERFAFQPFRLLDAVLAAGHLRIARRVSDALPTIKLRGRASAALSMLLEPLADASNRRKVLKLLTATAQGVALVQSRENLRLWMDRLFNVLPVECRGQLSFSTGLKQSPARSLRLSSAPIDKLEADHSARQLKARLVKLDADEPVESWDNQWAQTVDEMLAHGRGGELLSLLHQPQPGLELEDLATFSPLHAV